LDAPLLVLIAALLFVAVLFAALIRGIVSLRTGWGGVAGEVPRRDPATGGLRWKLPLFILALVFLALCLLSVPLYIRTNESEGESLFRSLRDRANLLLDSLASSAGACFDRGAVWELSLIPSQMAGVPEVRSVTISGDDPGTPFFDDIVWASNDPDILDKLDSPDLIPGKSRLQDSLSPYLETIAADAPEIGIAGPLGDEFALYRNWSEAVETATAGTATPGAATAGAATLWEDIILTEGSFIFYKPIPSSREPGLRGMVRMEVVLDPIFESLRARQRELLGTIVFIGCAAFLIGAAGALVLSDFIVKPIRRLENRVELIQDTENKAASELTIGKEIQKRFIPLETDGQGNKLSVGFKDTRNLQFFGYYEGAIGVSGDYFDYLDLDGRYFAIIKCDVAGKGVPAALIMIQVATMFLNYFKQWTPAGRGVHIEDMVYQINDFIETLGFKDRFAAFTLALFDSQTGLIRFCNAGDNLIHWFDASEAKMKATILPATPAAGVLPNRELEARGGYRVQNFHLDPGDILFLYTDGIEEARRRFRDRSFREIADEGGLEFEALGSERVDAIINAVMNRQIYTLRKARNPEGDQDLHFDFTRCRPSVEEAIMALVSVEQIFRLYKRPGMTADSRVLVDRKIDEFLQEHFVQYPVYCSGQGEYTASPMYRYYTRVDEDPQDDDLTIVGIKRK
jgi:serine phosphatase RsbU (regulator of sigma subunit)